MKKVVLMFSLLFLVSAFDENTLEDVKKKVTEGLGQLPDSIKSAIPQDLSLDEAPSIEEGEELLKKRCDRYGSNESFDNAMYAKEEINFCLQDLVNFEEIQKEIEEAKPTGDLDAVFKKYCRKSPQLRYCVTNFTSGIESCLSPEERFLKETILNITDALIRFICFKEGERIALFIAEGGPECITNNKEQIQQCLNSSFSHYIPEETRTQNDDIPMFKLGKDECRDVSKLQVCVVNHLEKCKDPTPANVVDSLMTFVRKVTHCQQYEPNSASLLTINSVVVALSVLVAVVVTFQ